MQKLIIQITSGKGPAECCRAVARVQQLMLAQAYKQKIKTEIVDRVEAEETHTFKSVTFTAEGENLDSFVREWQGTVQWISVSPFRQQHKRKNWFVGVNALPVSKLPVWMDAEVKLDTCRASGPGGQNVKR